jgi:hypothetical protein
VGNTHDNRLLNAMREGKLKRLLSAVPSPSIAHLLKQNGSLVISGGNLDSPDAERVWRLPDFTQNEKLRRLDEHLAERYLARVRTRVLFGSFGHWLLNNKHLLEQHSDIYSAAKQLHFGLLPSEDALRRRYPHLKPKFLDKRKPRAVKDLLFESEGIYVYELLDENLPDWLGEHQIAYLTSFLRPGPQKCTLI